MSGPITEPMPLTGMSWLLTTGTLSRSMRLGAYATRIGYNFDIKAPSRTATRGRVQVIE